MEVETCVITAYLHSDPHIYHRCMTITSLHVEVCSHIARLHRKRFRGVGEQRKTEELDFQWLCS